MCWTGKDLWLRLLHCYSLCLEYLCFLSHVHLSQTDPFPSLLCWELTLLTTLSKISPLITLSSCYICHCRVVFFIACLTHRNVSFTKEVKNRICLFTMYSAGALTDEWIQNHSKLGSERVIHGLDKPCWLQHSPQREYIRWGRWVDRS